MIRFENVTKRFGRKTVLDDLSFEIQRGETFVIVGLSGTGKSVSLRHMVRLLTPESGRVWIGDDCVSEANGSELQRILQRFGVLFQGAALLQWLNVLDNVCLPLRQTRRLPEAEILRLAEEKLEMVGLTGAAEKMPADISGGMRKRVGLARAIVTQQEIVLYDEPTSGLDPVMAEAINQLIKETQRNFNLTCVVISHDIESIFKIGDKIAMLYEGKIIESGTPEEVRATTNPVLKQFLTGSIEGPIKII